MKITGIKKAVGDYNRANKGGYYSPRYGRLMLDRVTGEVWTDEFYSLGHGDFNVYRSESIVNLGNVIGNDNNAVNMATVRRYAEAACAEYTA